MEKKNCFPKKTTPGNTRTTQQPPLLQGEVKHTAPTDILGTSGTGKAMELWRERWFFYSSSPAGGGNHAEHTHQGAIMIANGKCNFPFGFGKRCRRHRLLSSSKRYHLSPLTSGQLHSLHATIMARSQRQENGEQKLVDQASQISFATNCSSSSINRCSFTN